MIIERIAKKATKIMAKIPNGCIYLPPFSSVVDDMNIAKMTKTMKINSDHKNTCKLNFPEIICPNTTIAKTYSALLTATSTKRFFSLSLNFISNMIITKVKKFVKYSFSDRMEKIFI